MPFYIRTSKDLIYLPMLCQFLRHKELVHPIGNWKTVCFRTQPIFKSNILNIQNKFFLNFFLREKPVPLSLFGLSLNKNNIFIWIKSR